MPISGEFVSTTQYGDLEMDKQILFSVTRKDLRVDYFRAGGKGGQKQNKTSSACRITHPASGAVGESREERSQHQNRRIAFHRLANSRKFKLWLRAQSNLTQEVLNSKVEQENILKRTEQYRVSSNRDVVSAPVM